MVEQKIKKRGRYIKFTMFLMGVMLFSLISSCDGKKFHEVPLQQFVGTWSVKGRSMLNGIVFSIQSGKNGNLQGKILQLNDNKLVNMFMKPGDIFVKNISRASNFEFKILENKVGHQLFSLYDISTSHTFRAIFINKDTIGLGGENETLTASKIQYVRVYPKDNKNEHE